MGRANKSKGIVSWPAGERPRERLLSQGPNALTDAELLAILLRVGVRGKSAIDLGRELMKRFGSTQAILSASPSALTEFKGLGDAKIAQLKAALELGRRAALPKPSEGVILKGTEQAADYFIPSMRGLAEEHFRVAYLNRLGRILEDSLVAQGTVDSVRPQIRSIVSRAIKNNASALIAAHNHPSGAPEPSESDRLLTRDLIAACLPINIRVLDHLIFADQGYYSFADSGLLDELRLEVAG